MDLLDYGSSDDEGGDEPTVSQTQTQTSTNAAKTKSEAASAGTILGSSKLPPAAGNNSKKKENKKGKKILSLQAVLPAHILKQLTESQVQGNDDDDDDDNELQPSSLRTAAATAKAQAAAAGKDAGIDSFLSDLHQSAPAATKKLPSGTAPAKASSSSSSGKLGAAFLSTTTVVTTATRGEANAVRDIHSESTPLDDNKAQVMVEEKHGSSNPLLQSLPRPSRTAPLPASRSRKAPPHVAASARAAPMQDEAAIQHNLQHNLQQHQPATSNKKRRRQEMERLLRQGQFDAALAQNSATSQTVSLNQPQNFVPTDGAAQHVDTTGMVRMAATPMYDPSAGQAVAGGAAGKGRGKNQINHLLASAHNLEMARARGMMPKPGGNASHRASAKRKYGF